jgi:phage replication initiation protein
MNLQLNDQQSPSSNTGILNTNIILDYLSFTIENTKENVGRIMNAFDIDELEELSYGGYGYASSAMILDGGRVFWHSERPEMGMHIRLNSKSLALLNMTPLGLLNRVIDWGGKFRRLDLAFDDRDGTLNLDEMHQKLANGEVVTRWRRVARIVGREIGGAQKSGDTVAVGVRASNSYLRMYDKKLERLAKNVDVTDIEHWVRVELELKADKANEFGRIMAKRAHIQQQETVGELCANLLWGLLDFKDVNNEDDNKSRWDTSEFWGKFLRASSKLKLSTPKKDGTLDDSKDWVWKTVAPTLAMIILSKDDDKGQSGYDFIMECIVKGEERMSRSHQRRLFAYNAGTQAKQIE